MKIRAFYLFCLCMMLGMIFISVESARAGQVNGADIAEYARQFIGKTPYVYGGTSLSTGADCSGFLCRIYDHFGINLWANRAGLINYGVEPYGVKLTDEMYALKNNRDVSGLLPGDILIFSINGQGHVGFYSGNGNMIHCTNKYYLYNPGTHSSEAVYTYGTMETPLTVYAQEGSAAYYHTQHALAGHDFRNGLTGIVRLYAIGNNNQSTGILSLDGVLDGFNVNKLYDYGTADIYINGGLAASGRNDYYGELPAGTTYEITNIRANDGYVYSGSSWDNLSGTIAAGKTTSVVLEFDSSKLSVQGSFPQDIYNRYLNYGATYDVYFNGQKIADDVDMFGARVPQGVFYEIMDIKPKNGYRYAGVFYGSLTGTINSLYHYALLSFDKILNISADWIECGELPDFVNSNICDIEYYPTYYQVSAGSPGDGWSNGGLRGDEYNGSEYVPRYYWTKRPGWQSTEDSSANSIQGYRYKLKNFADKLVLPTGLTEIKDSAFEGSGTYQEVVLPKGLKKIGSRAFANNSSLLVVRVPDSVTEIGENAFSGSSKVVLLCDTNNTAAAYAANNNIPYIIVNL